MAKITPIFIFSLPRSGSTLLQRLLSNNDKAYAVGEMWILLKMLGLYDDSLESSLYWSDSARRGLKNFFEASNCSYPIYKDLLRDLVLRLYDSGACVNRTYFVDKTPRYALIADEIMETFHDGKFIFLWRHPLDIALSMMRTWSHNGALNLDSYSVDFHVALPRLIQASRRLSEKSLSVNYENLVQQPSVEARKIYEFVGIPYSESVIENISKVKFNSGDPTGQDEYNNISAHSLENSVSDLGNVLRRRVITQIIERIPTRDFEHMGYSKSEAISRIKKSRSGFDGILRDLKFYLRQRVKLSIYRHFCGDGYCYRNINGTWLPFR